MKRRAGTTIVSALLAALCGCAGCDAVPEDALESCDASQVVPGRVATDILFVIDDSSSMAEEQEKVRHALVRFVQALAASPIPDDFQIGVTNTSIEKFLLGPPLYPSDTEPTGFTFYENGPSGAPRFVPYPAGALLAVDPENLVSGNSSTYGDYFYTAPNFSERRILRWDSPSLTSDFQNNVLVGTSGSGREQPLRAAQLAFTNPQNVGFLRPGARLAIIFVTDEDDCSGPRDPSIMQDSDCAAASSLLRVAQFAEFLQGPIAGETRDVVVAAIAGVECTGSVCTSGPCTGALASPNRILQLLDLLPPHRTRLASICDPNFDAALLGFADAIMSKTLPLDGAPADWRMLVASIERPSVGTVPCAIAPYDAPASSIAAADAIYAPPLSGRPATLTFQRSCALEQGDRVAVQVVCVR